MTILMEMSHHDFFEIFKIENIVRPQSITFFPLLICLYCIDMHVVRKREKCTPLGSYISKPRIVNVGAEIDSIGMLFKEPLH